MPRDKIIIPDTSSFLYKTNIPVLISYINYGNHLGHDSLISILHEARLRFIKSLGIQNEISIDTNIGFVIGSLGVTYFNEAFHSNNLDVDIFVDGITRTSCDLYYKVSHNTSGEEQIVATAKTCLVFLNLINKTPAKIPQRFLDAIKLSVTG